MNFDQNQNKIDPSTSMGIYDRTGNNYTQITGDNSNYIHSNNFDSAIEKELFGVLDRIEKSYDPMSSFYKFSHVFYNITDKPFERPANFPIHLWNQALLSDRTLMPVILNKEQINERRIMQNDLIKKLNESQNVLYKKVEDLRIKREGLRDKFNVVLKKYRNLMGQYLLGEPNEDVYKLAIMSCERKKYWVRRKEEVMKCLNNMKCQLIKLDENVNELLEKVEKNKISSYLV